MDPRENHPAGVPPLRLAPVHSQELYTAFDDLTNMSGYHVPLFCHMSVLSLYIVTCLELHYGTVCWTQASRPHLQGIPVFSGSELHFWFL